MREGHVELPAQIDAHIGRCPLCCLDDSLLFVLKDSQGVYEHCMYCNGNFDPFKKEEVQ